MSEGRNKKIRLDNSLHLDMESDDSNAPIDLSLGRVFFEDSDTSTNPIIAPRFVKTTAPVKADFEDLHNDIAKEVIKHLGPDDRINLRLISSSKKYMFFDDNTVWRARFIRHFPHLTYQHDLSSPIDFKKLFIDTERSQYALLDKKTIVLLRKIKDSVLAPELFDLNEFQLGMCDASGISLIKWASLKHLQPFLDHYHQSTLSGFIASRSRSAKRIRLLTTLESIIFCQQGIKAFNDCIDNAPLAIFQEIKQDHRNLLPLAAQLGDADSVRELLRFNIDPNTQNNNGHTALHFASSHGHANIVAMLLAAGAHPNPKRADDLNPLVTALLYGSLGCAKLIRAAGGDPNSKHQRQAGEIMDEEDGLAPMNQEADNQTFEQYILTTAASIGRTDMVAALLAFGAAVNCVSEQYNDPPLYYAVLNRDMRCVETLLAANARIDIKTRTTKTNFADYLSAADPEVKARIPDFLAQFPTENICVSVTEVAVGLGYHEIARLLSKRETMSFEFTQNSYKS